MYLIIIMVLIILILAALAVPATSGHPTPDYFATVPIIKALHAYKVSFGAFPKGDNQAISAALRGDNPAGTDFLDAARTHLTPGGELLDTGGTPYRFYFSDDEVLIRSAGAGGRFHDSIFTRGGDLIYSSSGVRSLAYSDPLPGDPPSPAERSRKGKQEVAPN